MQQNLMGNNKIPSIASKTVYTSKASELMVTYDVTTYNRNHEFNNVVFGYSASGCKKISLPSIPSIDLQPGMVLMGASKLSAHVMIEEASVENPIHCFCLEISKEKVWKVLDKINEVYQIPDLIDEEQKLPILDIYSGEGSQKVLDTLNKIQELLIEDVIYKDYWIDLKIEELVLCCLQTNMRNILIDSYQKNQLLDHPLAYAIHHVKENLYSKIDMQTLSDKAFMSKATFYRQFKHHFGMTPVTFIHTERIKEARNLLKQTNKPIGEIGYQLGYSSPSYFAAQFERISGCSPKNYRTSGKVK